MHAVCCARPKELQADVESDARPLLPPLPSPPRHPPCLWPAIVFVSLARFPVDWHILHPFLSCLLFVCLHTRGSAVKLLASHVLPEFFTFVTILRSCVNVGSICRNMSAGFISLFLFWCLSLYQGTCGYGYREACRVCYSFNPYFPFFSHPWPHLKAFLVSYLLYHIMAFIVLLWLCFIYMLYATSLPKIKSACIMWCFPFEHHGNLSFIFGIACC